MRFAKCYPWFGAVLSALLLELPFPLAGPMPPWRALFAWFALAPLLMALVRCDDRPRPHRDGFLQGWLCGVIWYTGNCYWIYDTMHMHGNVPSVASALILLGFSIILGAYFGLFALGVVFVRHATHSRLWALVSVPFLWIALELLAARFTSVPWDQLGYSQVDNLLLTRLAPWTGVYGISFLLAAANALLLVRYVRPDRRIGLLTLAWPVLVLAVWFGRDFDTPYTKPTARAVLVQPNLSVTADNRWGGRDWDAHIAEYIALGGHHCGPYIAGIPQTGAPLVNEPCDNQPAPNVILLPESPAPFDEIDPHFRIAMKELAAIDNAPVMVDHIGFTFDKNDAGYHYYNSASVVTKEGKFAGRYDKIHLVPFGEFIPFANVLSFAHQLTREVSLFTPGDHRSVYTLADGHRYGIYICYESVFADEVRQFARNGAEVFINLSDDAWYGDTSAPWQHLNMGRMRAIENQRWVVRDTNDGVTSVIAPNGRVLRSIPRHTVGALAADFGFNAETTFYTEHGDVFAYACAILTMALLAFCAVKTRAN